MHLPILPLFAGTEVDPSVLRILERSCRNCHSEKTEWPWYSYIAHAGWLIEKDVQQAREHMNMSQWGDYGAGVQLQIITRMSAAVRSRQMPLPRYLLLHPDSKLSDREIAQIEAWTQTERRRLASRQLP